MDYIEKDEAKFGLQLTGFAAGLATSGPALGFSPTDIKSAADDALFYNYLLSRQQDAQAFGQAMTDYKNIARHGVGVPLPPDMPAVPLVPFVGVVVDPNIEGRFRQRSNQAKSATGYSPIIGQALKIVAPKHVFDRDSAQPRITHVTSLPDGIFIDIVKGHWAGLQVYTGTDGVNWMKDAKILRSPFVDNRLNKVAHTPEVRFYKFRYFDVAGVEIGLESEIVRVTAEIYTENTPVDSPGKGVIN